MSFKDNSGDYDYPNYKENSNLNYDQNFILGKNTKVKSKVFGDILPLYSSYVELNTVIVGSYESLVSFIVSSRVFFVCVLSFFSQIVNSAVYQSYLLSVTSYDTVSSLPDTFQDLKNRFLELIITISNENTRSLWWLEKKIDAQYFIKKIDKLVDVALRVVKKFYLTAVVTSFLIILMVAEPVTASSRSSFFYNFVDNYSHNSSSIQGSDKSGLSKLASTALLENEDPAESFTYHTVEKGQTLEEVSALYAVNTETIIYNNRLESEKLEEGQKIIIPSVDGFLYQTVDNIKVSELTRIYKVSEEEIVKTNLATFNTTDLSFPANTYVLIPTTNLSRIDELNQEEEARKKRVLELEAQRKAILRIGNGDSTVDLGFIYPTRGRIERGTAGHGYPAVDISNSVNTPILAAKGGTVIKSKSGCGPRSTGCNSGFGNFVEISHGNGLTTLYAHFNKISVSEGQTVRQGDIIGLMGNSGTVFGRTGVHLHFEVKINGARKAPENYLRFISGRYI